MEETAKSRILENAKIFGGMIYDLTQAYKNLEHFAGGIASKMRNASDGLYMKIEEGWYMPSGTNKRTCFEKALQYAKKCSMLIDRSEFMGAPEELFKEPKKLLDKITHQLHALLKG